ncbi:MAG: YfiR family protein [Bacteroidota bacterium]
MLFQGRNVFAQQIEEGDARAMIQANFLYQFAVNSNWPTEVKKGRFQIIVLGNEAVFKHAAEKYGTKPIGAQAIEVLSAPNWNSGQFAQIIFVDKSKKNELSKIIKEGKTKSMLIVTNWEGALNSGSGINFKNVENSIRYEMSESSLAERKITPGNKLLQWKVQ